MGRPMAAKLLLMLCLIALTTCSLSPRRAAALRVHGLRRGLEQATRGRLLADATEGGAVVPIHWSQAELNYVANFTVGTPPQPASAVIDLAGELVWTQCKQCQRCFGQDLPLFDPAASSTYRAEPCGTALCESVPKDSRNCSGNVCTYAASTNAGDTVGKVGVDTFAVGTAKASLAFGCVVESDIDTMGGPSGFVGLGRTPWSLVAQTNVTAFSYCLAPHDAGKNSALFLGSSAKLAGGNSASTPFVTTSGDDLSNYYKIHLEGLKAGDVVIPLPPSGSTVLLDTFSPVTFLVDGAYQAVKKAVTAAVGASPTATPVDPFDLCFPKASASSAPDLVFTFQGAAALTVPPSNYLLDYKNGTVCLAMLSSARLNSTELSVLGSLQQENFHMLFDLDKQTLSFQPADCSKLSS
ncbi:aspartic proteinase nepenthesin-1-like [Oryza brachyantha]|uniref:Peptidase A1 domain-containing protein n=1 Tax=Oryza brachyantha TaxID=4533 RepID=J3N4G7_ORYBR|nr:aspartic proteinase nepenthesin-1-like [Oryza brachyantha]